MEEKEKIQMLPFQAVNEFMRDDYRLVVLSEVFNKFDLHTPQQRQLLTRMVAKGVQIPGFRNSGMAPAVLKAKNSSGLFEKSSEFSALVMECWSHLHEDLKKSMWDILKERGWELQPLELDRSQLPGFRIEWPKGDGFEVLIGVLKGKNPTLVESDDNISLMAVWVGNRLPYDLFTSEDTD
jgi:hypothetical protein